MLYFNLYFNFCLFLRSISVPPHQNISSLTRDLCCSLLLMECPEQYLERSSSPVTNCCLSKYVSMLCISLAVFAGSCLWLFFSVSYCICPYVFCFPEVVEISSMILSLIFISKSVISVVLIIQIFCILRLFFSVYTQYIYI